MQDEKDLGDSISESWQKHADVTRRLQRVAAQTLQNEKGKLADDQSIELICTLPNPPNETEGQ